MTSVRGSWTWVAREVNGGLPPSATGPTTARRSRRPILLSPPGTQKRRIGRAFLTEFGPCNRRGLVIDKRSSRVRLIPPSPRNRGAPAMVTSVDLLTTEGAFTRELRTARNGSELTVWDLLAECRGYLLHIAVERLDPSLQSKANPSDLVHETLLEAYRDFTQFRGGCEAEWLAWLRRLLIHNLANFERRYLGTAMRCAHREVSLADRGVAEGVPALAPSPSSKVMAGERASALERGLTQLPDDYRRVILWHHREGLPFDEIGNRLGRSPDAVRRLWSRAVDRLQELLNPNGRAN